MTFYTDLQNLATGLLAEFGQGVVEAGRTNTLQGAEEWSPPTTLTQWTRINAVFRGVSEQYVDGANILASDLQGTIEATKWQFRAGDKLRIDGVPAAILRIDRIPAAGTIVAYRVFARGGGVSLSAPGTA